MGMPMSPNDEGKFLKSHKYLLIYIAIVTTLVLSIMIWEL